MKTLWEIDRELQETIKVVIENEGEIDDNINEILNINQSEFQEKALNYVYLIEGLENDTEVREAEIKRLKAKNEAIYKTIDYLKSNLLRALTLRGGKAELGDFKLSVRKSKAINITDISKIPFDYTTVKLKDSLDNDTYCMLLDFFDEKESFNITPNKNLIKTAIELGEKIEGAEIIENQSLTIK